MNKLKKLKARTVFRIILIKLFIFNYLLKIMMQVFHNLKLIKNFKKVYLFLLKLLIPIV